VGMGGIGNTDSQCWEAIILLCENLQFGASLYLRCTGVGLDVGWVSFFGGLGWVWVE